MSSLSVCLLSLVTGNHSGIIATGNAFCVSSPVSLGSVPMLESSRLSCQLGLIMGLHAQHCCPSRAGEHTTFSTVLCSILRPICNVLHQRCSQNSNSVMSLIVFSSHSWSNLIYSNKHHFQHLKSMRQGHMCSLACMRRSENSLGLGLPYHGISCCYPHVDQDSRLMSLQPFFHGSAGIYMWATTCIVWLSRVPGSALRASCLYSVSPMELSPQPPFMYFILTPGKYSS